MATLALIVAAIALLGVVFVGLAVSEVLQSASEKVGDPDFTQAFELPADIHGVAPSRLGLPEDLDAARGQIVLFLSPLCKVCNQITEELRTGPLLEGLTLVLTAGQRTQLDDWNTALGGTYQVLIDYDAAVANRLGIEGSPAAIGIADGHLEFGAYLGGLGALNRVLADRNRFVAGNTAQHGTEVRSSPSGEFS